MCFINLINKRTWFPGKNWISGFFLLQPFEIATRTIALKSVNKHFDVCLDRAV